jgi:hypothetical protein
MAIVGLFEQTQPPVSEETFWMGAQAKWLADLIAQGTGPLIFCYSLSCPQPPIKMGFVASTFFAEAPAFTASRSLVGSAANSRCLRIVVAD